MPNTISGANRPELPVSQHGSPAPCGGCLQPSTHGGPTRLYEQVEFRRAYLALLNSLQIPG